MDEKTYLHEFDAFLNAHPEIDPAWRGLIEPAVQDSEAAIFSFIMSYIFM